MRCRRQRVLEKEQERDLSSPHNLLVVRPTLYNTLPTSRPFIQLQIYDAYVYEVLLPKTHHPVAILQLIFRRDDGES